MFGHPQYPMSWVGLPPDAAAWSALLLAVLILTCPRRGRAWLAGCPTWLTLTCLALLSACLSLIYFEGYLGGRPRIIDASAYLLEAKTFSTGQFSFEVPEPTALFRGRFLVPVEGTPQRLAPIFPPGYPALLALGVIVTDVRVVGLLLAIGITLSTAWLAYELTRDQRVVKLAALLSTLCAALRYHTADTMSHGLSILLLCSAGALCLRILGGPLSKGGDQLDAGARFSSHASTLGSPRPSPSGSQGPLFLALGFVLGWLFITRPLTGLVGGAALLSSLVLSRRPDARTLSGFALGALPPLVMLLAQQWAVTGSPFGSIQLRYYALADGPERCFGLGLGRGCLFEHGDVVRAQGGNGLTPLWMLKNYLFRLHWHSLDVANLELLWLLGMSWFLRRWRSRLVRSQLAVVLLIPAAYSLFYFQGSYPGGGARFLSELIPSMQVAIAAAAVELRWQRATVVASLLGFSLHAAFLHRALPPAPSLETRTRDGEQRVSTDYAFNLLFEPGRNHDQSRLARSSHDDRQLRPRGPARPLSFEAEADWPIRQQTSLWSFPAHSSDNCVSGGRGLRLGSYESPRRPPSLTLELTGVPAGDYELTLHSWLAGHGCMRKELRTMRLPATIVLTEAELAPLLIRGGGLLDRVTAIPSTKRGGTEKNR